MKLNHTSVRRLGLGILVLAYFISTFLPATANAQTIQSLPRLLIDEVQSGGCSAGNVIATCTEDTKMEFIRLHNYAAEPLVVKSWKVQYLSASGQTVTDLATLDGTVTPGGDILIAHTGYFDPADRVFGVASDTGKLAKSGGMVRLVDTASDVIDLVGWGNATKLDPRWPVTIQIGPGYAIHRVQPIDMVASGGLAVFSFPSYPPTPRGGGLSDNQASGVSDDATTGPLIPTVNACKHVEISELLPNPAGSDTDHEFIELHNPMDSPVSLAGCTLRSSANTKKYLLGNLQLDANAYLSLDNATTGLTLTNSSGGSVTLSDGVNDIQTVTYTQDMADDISWALIDGVWMATTYATPGAANILSVIGPDGTDTVMTTATPIVCAIGKERNPLTGRCRNIVGVATPAQCSPNQTRNPATNRCVKAATATQSICKPDQVRNPDTGRCKNAVTATGKKPCAAGQIRNPDTGRCKKDAASTKLASVNDVRGSQIVKNSRWLLLFGALGVAIAYGCYEWRQELRSTIRKFSILKRSDKLTFQRK